MEPKAAAEHLQVIRTLMERSALYRRTLAPIMLFVGAVGTITGAAGIALGVDTTRAFYGWWFAAAAVAVAGAFVIARRQALEEGEAFWSPPTVRVTHAIVPPLAAGLLLSLAQFTIEPAPSLGLFITANGLLYACAVHAAGSFMPRGMKLFGFIMMASAAGALVAWQALGASLPGPRLGHLLMGVLFGVLHLAYGVYLYATEPRKTLP